MDIVERLGGYNPPDRVNIEQRQIAVDILDAKNEIERLREVLKAIGYGPPNEGEYLDMLNQFVDLARAALKEKE